MILYTSLFCTEWVASLLDIPLHTSLTHIYLIQTLLMYGLWRHHSKSMPYVCELVPYEIVQIICHIKASEVSLNV